MRMSIAAERAWLMILVQVEQNRNALKRTVHG
ncbi:hypothetical protein FG94_04987 [Massilia sp. LC238]|nr:hypothetical protein FG94_04987 [Massilia sp. LC238]